VPFEVFRDLVKFASASEDGKIDIFAPQVSIYSPQVSTHACAKFSSESRVLQKWR